MKNTAPPVSTDAHFQAWMTAPENRRAASHAALMGESAPESEDGPCFTITDAAKRAGVGRPTLYRAIRAGALVAAPLYAGGRPRIRESDFRRWMNARGGKA